VKGQIFCFPEQSAAAAGQIAPAKKHSCAPCSWLLSVSYCAVQDEKLFRAKISDFGLSAHMTAGQKQVNISQGTEAYLPKEVFQNLAVTEASDIYAMGLLMWEIFYGIFWFIVWDTEKRRKKCARPSFISCNHLLPCQASQAMYGSNVLHVMCSWRG
jgi:serine/threonine protein kinase